MGSRFNDWASLRLSLISNLARPFQPLLKTNLQCFGERFSSYESSTWPKYEQGGGLLPLVLGKVIRTRAHALLHEAGRLHGSNAWRFIFKPA